MGAMWDVISGMMLSETNSIAAEFTEAVRLQELWRYRSKQQGNRRLQEIRESKKYSKM